MADKVNIDEKNAEAPMGEEVKVKRSITVDLKWTCRHNKLQHKTFSYLPSRVVQHEMDHLNGKLIID